MSDGRSYLVFRLGADDPIVEASLPPGYDERLWRPSLRDRTPPGPPALHFHAWWLFDRIGGFANRGYAAQIVSCGDEIAHRSMIFPPYFAFPFMAHDDLQIGNTFTAPGHRGRGLASFAIAQIVARFRQPGRAFWYVADESNAPSIRAVQRAGFTGAGTAVRLSRLGLRPLGHYAIERADTHRSHAVS
jgi:RimJ/RimL family protein N-acetyltransferase